MKPRGMESKKPSSNVDLLNDLPLKQNSKAHKVHLKWAELQYWKGKVFFLYELILLSTLVGFCIFIIVGGFPWFLIAGAAAVLWFIAKKIIQHMTDTL